MSTSCLWINVKPYCDCSKKLSASFGASCQFLTHFYIHDRFQLAKMQRDLGGGFRKWRSFFSKIVFLENAISFSLPDCIYQPCRISDVNAPLVGLLLVELTPEMPAIIRQGVGGRSPIIRVKMAASLHYVSCSYPRCFCAEFRAARPMGLRIGLENPFNTFKT